MLRRSDRAAINFIAEKVLELPKSDRGRMLIDTIPQETPNVRRAVAEDALLAVCASLRAVVVHPDFREGLDRAAHVIQQRGY